MSRLFITQRELNFISDVTKEVIKDVVGQKIYLFPISELKTQAHEVYGESLKKIFENPIEIEALISQPEVSVKIDKFGVDTTYKLEVYLQWRDLVDKGINIHVGDYFSFGEVFYEISEYLFTRNIYGMPEHLDGMKLTGLKVRESQFKAKIFGPTDILHEDPGSVQNEFVQQRGFEENSTGKTNDKRDLIENGVLEKPITGPKEVGNPDEEPSGSRFYDED